MASLSKKTKTIRANKHKKAGRDRKRALERDGSTPAFPVHKDDKKSA